MSAFGVIKHLTDTLVHGLNAALSSDPLTAGFTNTVFTESPAATDVGTAQKSLSFWPYRLTRSEYVNDQAPVPLGSSLLGVPPLVVDVWYLVTPVSGSGDSDQLLLEKTLQFVYDLGPVDLGTDQPYVTFETPGTDELFRLWSALNIAYALSCVFVARHVSIDSLREPGSAARVIERYDRYVRIAP